MKFEHTDDYSFGFIKKDNEYFFNIPSKIFKENLIEQLNQLEYNDKYKILFNFYKILRIVNKFLEEKDKSNKVRDGTLDNKDNNKGIASQVGNENDRDSWFYSKLEYILQILANPLDFSLFSLRSKVIYSDSYDYPDLDAFFDNSLYLDDVILTTESKVQTKILSAENELMNMYCYVYHSIKKEFEPDEIVDGEIQSAATEFRLEHSLPENLFTNLKESIEVLKDRLEFVNRNAYLRDRSYYEIYDFLENFLYGNISETGELKIFYDNFWQIWELLCLACIYKNYETNIQFVDYKGTVKIKKEKENTYPYYIHFGNNSKILIKPDVVLKDENKKESWIIDFKYEDLDFYEDNNEEFKINKDLIKQLIYKKCHNTIFDEEVKLIFLLPEFNIDSILKDKHTFDIFPEKDNIFQFIKIDFWRAVLNLLSLDLEEFKNFFEEKFEKIQADNQKNEINLIHTTDDYEFCLEINGKKIDSLCADYIYAIIYSVIKNMKDLDDLLNKTVIVPINLEICCDKIDCNDNNEISYNENNKQEIINILLNNYPLNVKINTKNKPINFSINGVYCGTGTETTRENQLVSFEIKTIKIS